MEPISVWIVHGCLNLRNSSFVAPAECERLCNPALMSLLTPNRDLRARWRHFSLLMHRVWHFHCLFDRFLINFRVVEPMAWHSSSRMPPIASVELSACLLPRLLWVAGRLSSATPDIEQHFPGSEIDSGWKSAAKRREGSISDCFPAVPRWNKFGQ